MAISKCKASSLFADVANRILDKGLVVDDYLPSETNPHALATGMRHAADAATRHPGHTDAAGSAGHAPTDPV